MSAFPAIPGETPMDDISGLKVKNIRFRSELNLAEAENIRRAVVKYLARKPSRRSARFDLAWSLKLHKEMFGRVWKWAGQLRTRNLNLGVDALHVESSLYQLFANLKYREKLEGVDIFIEAVTLHHQAVRIHPFLNGNGRWSRLLSNIWLKLHGHPLVLWPEEAVGEVSPIRQDYLAAIRGADAGKMAALIDLHRRFLERP
jgi:Fic-DOC domain mobile mystery protein B